MIVTIESGFSRARNLLAGALLAGLVCAPFSVALDIQHMSGGVGTEERLEFTKRETDGAYNLKLIFATQDVAAYLSYVEVRIANAKNETLLATTSAGPWFLAKLPPGRYTVSATALGSTQTQNVEVGKSKLSRLAYYWKR